MQTLTVLFMYFLFMILRRLFTNVLEESIIVEYLFMTTKITATSVNRDINLIVFIFERGNQVCGNI